MRSSLRRYRPGLPAHYSPHSFRATGITNFLENDGTLEAAQPIAGHARQLYDRRSKRFCSKTSSASGINVNLKNNARLHVRVQHVAPPVPADAKLGYTLRVIDWLLMVAYEWQSPDWSVAAKVYEPGSKEAKQELLCLTLTNSYSCSLYTLKQ